MNNCFSYRFAAIYFKISISYFLLISIAFCSSTLAEEACDSLDHGKCLDSKNCIIDYAKSDSAAYGYVCRKRESLCETNLPEDIAKRSLACEKREGCVMRGHCYCGCLDKKHPMFDKCVCDCSGGLPLDCRSETKKSDDPN